jgi:rod shape-determining protein MreC
MIQFLRQKVPTLIFIVLISAMLVLMSHDVGNRGGKDIAGELLFQAGAPAVRAGSSATAFVSDLFRNYADLRGARAESRRLSEELLRTQRELDRLREKAAAGERLQGLLELKQSLPPGGISARVVGSGFASGADTLLIDRGTSDGIQAGMAVIAVGGVVGRVVMVAPQLAKVQCLTDTASGIAVMMDQGGWQGVVIGKNKGACEVQYLQPPYAEVTHGDLLVTSGLDQIYPRGIPVGRIVGTPKGEGIDRRFEVGPLVDFSRIAEVLVLRTAPLSRPDAAGAAGPVPAGGTAGAR